MPEKTTVLLVDDEPNVLSSLRRVLRREGWSLLTASGGQEGLDILARNSVAVVVSDVRMPEMDGVTFLERVRALYPDTARIILTGFVDRASVARAVEKAGIQQMISKPWDDEELKAILRDVIAQRTDQDAEGTGLKSIINEIDALPPVPGVYLDVRRLIEEEQNPSARKVADVIVKDQSVAAKVLQVANTAVFGQRRGVKTISRAIVVLGLDFTSKIVLSAGAFRSLNVGKDDIAGLSHEAIWEHSFRCGVAARYIAMRATKDRERIEQAMLAGILHDVGKLVFVSYLHERYREIVRTARATKAVLVDVEKETLKSTHAAAGAYLADWWNFPVELADAIRCHHDPAASTQTTQLAAIVHIADVLANRIDTNGSGNGRPPDPLMAAYETLKVGSEELRLVDMKLRADISQDGGNR